MRYIANGHHQIFSNEITTRSIFLGVVHLEVNLGLVSDVTTLFGARYVCVFRSEIGYTINYGNCV